MVLGLFLRDLLWVMREAMLVEGSEELNKVELKGRPLYQCLVGAVRGHVYQHWAQEARWSLSEVLYLLGAW